MLVESILRGIDNDGPLERLVCIPSPLGDLIASYGKEPEARINPVTPEMTGAQFKEALSKINAEKLVTMLSKYSKDTLSLHNPLVYAEDPEKRDKRRLRHFLVKGSFIVASMMVMIIVGASMAIAYRSGVLDNAVVQTLMAGAGEIFRLLFSSQLN